MKIEWATDGPVHKIDGKDYIRISSIGKTAEEYCGKEGMHFAFSAEAAKEAERIIACALADEPFMLNTMVETDEGVTFAYEPIRVQEWPSKDRQAHIRKHPNRWLASMADRGTVLHHLQERWWMHELDAPENVQHVVEDVINSDMLKCQADQVMPFAAALRDALEYMQDDGRMDCVGVEVPVVNQERPAAGRVDGILKSREDKTTGPIDLKTMNTLSTPQLRHIVQVAAYSDCDSAVINNTLEPLPDMDTAWVLCVAPWQWRLYEVQDLKEKWIPMSRRALDLMLGGRSLRGATKKVYDGEVSSFDMAAYGGTE